MQDRKTAKLPGAKGDIAAAIRDAVEESLLGFDSMLPAIVESYDRKKNVAKVRPLIAIVDVNNFSQARRALSNVPVLALGGGGYVINFPLKKGDLGWVHAADRDITEYKEKLRDIVPKTSRSHSFSDSMFVPDVMRNYTISEEDDGAMVIQTTDGTTKIAIHPDWIKIKAPTKVVSDSPKTHATGDLQVDGNATVGGNLTVKGGLSTGGDLSVSGKSTLKDTTVNGQPVSGGGGGGGGDYLTKTEAAATYFPYTGGVLKGGMYSKQHVVVKADPSVANSPWIGIEAQSGIDPYISSTSIGESGPAIALQFSKTEIVSAKKITSSVGFDGRGKIGLTTNATNIGAGVWSVWKDTNYGSSLELQHNYDGYASTFFRATRNGVPFFGMSLVPNSDASGLYFALGFHSYKKDLLMLLQESGLTVSGTVTCTNLVQTSDIRLKSKVRKIDNALRRLECLDGYFYEKDGLKEAGLMAPDVERALEESVHTITPDPANPEKTIQGVSYSGATTLLVEAVKELKCSVFDEIKSLKQMFEELKNELSTIKGEK